jgi:hypothetical protein
MIDSCYGLTSCPVCGKLVAIVISPEWADAQYTCPPPCGKTFEFRALDDVDES